MGIAGTCGEPRGDPLGGAPLMSIAKLGEKRAIKMALLGYFAEDRKTGDGQPVRLRGFFEAGLEKVVEAGLEGADVEAFGFEDVAAHEGAAAGSAMGVDDFVFGQELQ